MTRPDDPRLGPMNGVRRGWTRVTLDADEVRVVLSRYAWLDVERRGEPEVWRAWKARGRFKRLDVAFGGGSLVSVRRLVDVWSVRLSRWKPAP